MKKYFLKKGNREIKLGEKLKMRTPVDTSYGKGVTIVTFEITEPVLKKLIDDGFVTVVETPEKKPDNLYSKIKKFLDEDGIVVVTGDSKEKFKKELLDIVDCLFDDEE